MFYKEVYICSCWYFIPFLWLCFCKGPSCAQLPFNFQLAMSSFLMCVNNMFRHRRNCWTQSWTCTRRLRLEKILVCWRWNTHSCKLRWFSKSVLQAWNRLLKYYLHSCHSWELIVTTNVMLRAVLWCLSSLFLSRRLKEDSCHLGVAVGSTPEAAVVSGLGEGAPEGGGEACHCMQ